MEEEKEERTCCFRTGPISVDIETTCIEVSPNRYWGPVQDCERSLTRLGRVVGEFEPGPRTTA
jgi:hypothetical protein